jgi:hypothetical protein
LTSANLNHNPRIEDFHAADDPGLFDDFWRMADVAFQSQDAGCGFNQDAEKMKPNVELKRVGMIERARREGCCLLSEVPTS